MDTLLRQIYQSMNLAIFEKQTNDDFVLLSENVEWLAPYLPDPTGTYSHYNLTELFPFLECFLPEAIEHWDNHALDIIHSGIWLAKPLDDSIANGSTVVETALEAKAVWADGRAILIIENAQDNYNFQTTYLQKARDSLLVKEVLENEVTRRTQLIKEREEEIAIKLVSITSYRDEETGAHIRRIGLYSALIAEALGWDRRRVEDIRIAAPMHDIGKIGIPDRILLKSGKLTESEFEIMKRHTTIGAEMLKGSHIPVMDMAAEIALNHHERWDGSGYPNGLAGKEIPESARITTIVDIYDALVHERVYKKAFPEAEALRLLDEAAGHHIDPHIYQVFLKNLPEIRKIRMENQDCDNSSLFNKLG